VKKGGKAECPNEGCVETLLPRALAQHEETCKHRLVACKFCGSQDAFYMLAEHKVVCPKIKILCPNEGCQVMHARGAMNVHRAACDHEDITCPCPGCETHLLRKGTKAHLVKTHMESAVDLLLDAWARVAQLEEIVGPNNLPPAVGEAEADRII